eukprot:847586-Rhodomonas_salina.3
MKRRASSRPANRRIAPLRALTPPLRVRMNAPSREETCVPLRGSRLFEGSEACPFESEQARPAAPSREEPR